MSADRQTRTARWRRWVSGLPVVVALLFATTTVAGTVDPGAGPGPGPHPTAGTLAHTSAQQAAGQRPDVPVIVKRGGSWTVAPDLAAIAWAAARASTPPAGRLVRRQLVEGRRGNPQRETYQGRGPPGTA